MRRLLVTSGLLALAAMLWPLACALTPNQAHTQPNYPEPEPLGVSASRDAGRE